VAFARLSAFPPRRDARRLAPSKEFMRAGRNPRRGKRENSPADPFGVTVRDKEKP
jgi:hypothetical protein